MKPLELLQKFEEVFDREYTDKQRAAFLAKLDCFEERDLHRIYSETLELSKKLPTIAEVFTVARMWGLMQPRESRTHIWRPSDCKLCAGEGRVLTVWLLYFDESFHREAERLEHIMPYSSLEAVSYALKPSEYFIFARCKCEAGDVATLPPCWPRWKAEQHPVRII